MKTIFRSVAMLWGLMLSQLLLGHQQLNQIQAQVL